MQRNPATPAFIDTHVHFWDLRHPGLAYSWLMPGVKHPVPGDIEVLKMRQWEPQHLRLEAWNAGVCKVVHVQAALGTADPRSVDEKSAVDVDDLPRDVAGIARA